MKTFKSQEEKDELLKSKIKEALADMVSDPAESYETLEEVLELIDIQPQ